MIPKVGINTGLIEAEIKSSLEKTEKVEKRELLKSVSKEEEEKLLNNLFLREEIKSNITNYKALWVIDEKNNVYIRIEDEKGNVIKQIPPEEIIKLREKLNEIMKGFFNNLLGE
jgi:uncharacterized FlaG/YvyC family protein